MKEYLLVVGKGAGPGLTQLLDLPAPPTHARLATMAPLSNWGYPPSATATLLKVGELGVVVGMEENPSAPHDFIPWQNVAYISDGTRLAAEVAKTQGKR